MGRGAVLGTLAALFFAALGVGSAAETAAGRDPGRGRELYRAALAAREANDLAGYRARLEEAVRTLPDPSNLWFRLAGARTLAGDRTAAFEALQAQLAAGVFRPDFETNLDLGSLHEHSRWAPIVAAHAKLAEPTVRSEEGFRLAEAGLLVEGIARDAESGSVFLSVVNRRQILRRSSDGAVTVFAKLEGSLPGSPLGMAVDAARKRLWVATAGLPHGEGLPEAEKNRGALAAFDLSSGGVIASFALEGEGHLANDLVLASSGVVYVTDPGAASVWRLATDGELERLALSGTLVSPGGVALSADERLLYIADWSYGLAVVDLETRALDWIAPPVGATLLGIDGLVRDGSALIAIQNGVSPPRISRFDLAPDGHSIAGAAVLERGVPEWDEPTLGVVVDDGFLYVSNSHWPRFGEDGAPTDPEALTPAVVRRLPLR